MITRLSGTLERVEGQEATIASGDIAYQVLVPAYVAEGLAPRAGQRVTLVTLQYLESQNQGASFVPRLIGFRTEHERRFFELFTTVKGIGNRKALRASVIEPAAISRAIAGRDAKALTKLPEIGSRMAETIIAELSGKVEAFLTASEIESLDAGANGKPAPGKSPILDDAVAALIALGQTRQEAETQVTRAIGKLGTPRSVEQVLERVFGGV